MSLTLQHVTRYTLSRSTHNSKRQFSVKLAISTQQELIQKYTHLGNVRQLSDWAPSWTELDGLLKQRRIEYSLPEPDYENDPTNVRASRRTFGKADGIRVKLYRDSAGWCPFCHKLQYYLEEKQIPYTIEKINMNLYGAKKPEYLEKVPSGLLPTIELDGQIMLETADIIDHLEKEFGGIDLQVPETNTEFQERVESTRKAFFAAWSDWRSSEDDNKKKELCEAVDSIDQILGEKEGPFFYDRFSIEDINFTPFALRIRATLLYFKGLELRSDRWPNLKRWYETMETRDAYVGMMSDLYSFVHGMDAQLKFLGRACVMNEEGKKFAQIIDGKDGESWELPLPPLSNKSFEPYIPGENLWQDKLEAAAAVVVNHESVIKFAARGCGVPEQEQVKAALADPGAMPQHEDEVDVALRQIVFALLHDYSALDLHNLTEGVKYDGKPALLALEYLRDRIGVPRDMRFPAARQLRGHINWFIRQWQQ